MCWDVARGDEAKREARATPAPTFANITNVGYANDRAMAKWHLGVKGNDGPWFACVDFGCCYIGNGIQ